MKIYKSGFLSLAGLERLRLKFRQLTVLSGGVAGAMKVSVAALLLLVVGGIAFLGRDDSTETVVNPESEAVVSASEGRSPSPDLNPTVEVVNQPVVTRLTVSSAQITDPNHPSLIAKEIIVALVRNTEYDAEWGTRIAKAEIAPLINELYLARKRGFEPNLATYRTDAYAPDDMELLDELQQSIQARPELNLLVEGMLRQYGLMHCETLDAALRSWLIPS